MTALNEISGFECLELSSCADHCCVALRDYQSGTLIYADWDRQYQNWGVLIKQKPHKGSVIYYRALTYAENLRDAADESVSEFNNKISKREGGQAMGDNIAHQITVVIRALLQEYENRKNAHADGS